MSAAVRTEGAPTTRSGAWRWVAGGFAVAFGLATIMEGGSVLLGGSAARAEAGHVVPFVLAFNFAAGFVYVAAGAATLAGRAWAAWLALALASSTLLVFAAFGVHVIRGGEFEARTVAAMTMRSAFWVVQSLTLPMLRPGRAS